MKKDGTAPEKKAARKTSTQQKPYLTKRILISAAKRGFKAAAEEAMQTMGYTIIAKKIAKDLWVVKKYADGRIEKIKKIDTQDAPITD